jgi:hypothetical protein
MLAAVFGPYVVVVVLAVLLPIWAIGDAMSRPAPAFYGAGSNKTAWVMVLLVSMILGVGFFMGAFYLISVRRKVRQQMVLLSHC